MTPFLDWLIPVHINLSLNLCNGVATQADSFNITRR